jgi:hypothetical protein
MRGVLASKLRARTRRAGLRGGSRSGSSSISHTARTWQNGQSKSEGICTPKHKSPPARELRGEEGAGPADGPGKPSPGPGRKVPGARSGAKRGGRRNRPVKRDGGTEGRGGRRSEVLGTIGSVRGWDSYRVAFALSFFLHDTTPRKRTVA